MELEEREEVQNSRNVFVLGPFLKILDSAKKTIFNWAEGQLY
jgi:hypothetical protein